MAPLLLIQLSWWKTWYLQPRREWARLSVWPGCPPPAARASPPRGWTWAARRATSWGGTWSLTSGPGPRCRSTFPRTGETLRDDTRDMSMLSGPTRQSSRPAPCGRSTGSASTSGRRWPSNYFHTGGNVCRDSFDMKNRLPGWILSLIKAMRIQCQRSPRLARKSSLVTWFSTWKCNNNKQETSSNDINILLTYINP